MAPALLPTLSQRQADHAGFLERLCLLLILYLCLVKSHTPSVSAEISLRKLSHTWKTKAGPLLHALRVLLLRGDSTPRALSLLQDLNLLPTESVNPAWAGPFPLFLLSIHGNRHLACAQEVPARE